MLNFVSVLNLHITILSFFLFMCIYSQCSSFPLVFLTLKKPLDIHKFFNGILMITETLTLLGHLFLCQIHTFFLSLLQILQVLLQLFTYLDSLCLWSFLEEQLHYFHLYMTSDSPVMQYMQQTGCEQKAITVLPLLSCLEG